MTITKVMVALGLLVGLALACNIPNTVDMGGSCIDSPMCKSPADTCINVGSESYCSKQCTTGSPCPDDFTCVQMDMTLDNAAGSHALGAMGYCLPASVAAGS